MDSLAADMHPAPVADMYSAPARQVWLDQYLRLLLAQAIKAALVLYIDKVHKIHSLVQAFFLVPCFLFKLIIFAKQVSDNFLYS
jgi:hypothetical protein